MESASFSGGEARGPASLLWLEGTGRESGPVQLHITADTVEGHEFAKRSVVFPAGAGVIGGIEPAIPINDGGDIVPVSAVNATISLLSISQLFAVAVEPLGAGFDLRVQSGPFSVVPAAGAHMHVGGVREGSFQGPPTGDDYFLPADAAGPLAVGRAAATDVALVLEGDFTLQILEVDLHMQADGKERVLRGRTEYGPLFDGAPPESELAAQMATDHFLRLHLTGARLEFRTPNLDGILDWAVDSLEGQPQGPVTLLDARGQIVSGDRVQTLAGERHVIEEPPVLLLQPIPGRLDVQLGSDDAPTGSFAVPQVSPAATVGLLLAGIVALATVVGGTVVRRRRRAAPALAAVEGALQEKQYLRAARLAEARLLRDPRDHKAFVARSVALSKAGRHEDVIKEGEARLAHMASPDGVLHYLVGLAYLKTGRSNEAADRLREAVRRTPSLEPDVAALLPAQPPTAHSGYGYV